MRNLFGYSSLLLLLGLPFARATDLSVGELTTVFSTVHNGYRREKLPDGSFKPVRYAFGEGTFDPGNIVDPSLDHLKFGQLAKLLSAPLAKLGYRPGWDRNNIDQLIVVHWGRTVGWDSAGFGDAYGTLDKTYDLMKSAFPNLTPAMVTPNNGGPLGPGQSARPMTRGLGGSPGAANEMDYMMLMLSMQDDARNRTDVMNARIIGYLNPIERLPAPLGNLTTSFRREQLMQELEDDRYYVVLIAYDFPATLKSRQRKVLWITRFSLQTRGNDFDQCINRMIRTASPCFGRSSDGLCREQAREGHVETGELDVIDYEEPKK